jgi:hypothetical protein
MRDVRRGGWLLVASGMLACGGAAQSAPVTSPDESGTQTEAAPDVEAVGANAAPTNAGEPSAQPGPAAPSPVEEEAPVAALPTECKKVGDLCLPPRAFVKKLCLDAYPGAAIRLFEKSSPFSRGYIRVRTMQAINTLGGPAGDTPLGFGEEVLILTRTGGAGPGAMQVSGMGGYDVLRWDGTCATLADGELAARPPIAPRHAPFAWQYIDTSIQRALLENTSIDSARKNQRKHCQGVSMGRRSASCIAADAKLNERIVMAVRTGMPLPNPDRLP